VKLKLERAKVGRVYLGHGVLFLALSFGVGCTNTMQNEARFYKDAGSVVTVYVFGDVFA